MTRPALLAVLAIGVRAACTSASPRQEAVAVSSPAPTPAADSKPAAPVSAPAPPTLGALVAELAVVRRGELLCADAAQCSSRVAWSNCGVLAMPELGVASGEAVHLIGASGVASAILEVADEEASLVPPPGKTIDETVSLALQEHAPSPAARLQAIDLAPARPAKEIRAWVDTDRGEKHRPLGEIRGNFGDGVDRIVLFEPVEYPNWDTEEAQGASEQALLVEGETPRGWLPIVRKVRHDRLGLEWLEGSRGFHAVATVDLDGDGVLEVLWSARPNVESLVTSLCISYYEDGAFHLESLASCSYNGCEAFLSDRRCRAGTVKVVPRD